MRSQTFKQFQKVGEEAMTGLFYTDANNKSWPIYMKIIDFGAGPNAGAKSVAHGVANLKMDADFDLEGRFVKLATAPVIAGKSAALTINMHADMAQITMTSTGDLTTYTGRAYFWYCKTTD